MKRIMAVIISACMVFTIAGAETFAVTGSSGTDEAAAQAVEGTGSAADEKEAAPASAEEMADLPLSETAATEEGSSADPQGDSALREAQESAADGQPQELTDMEQSGEDITGREKEVQLMAAPSLKAPKNLKAVAGYNSVRLSWSRVSGADKYIIMRSVAGKSKFSKIGTTKKTSFNCKVPTIYKNYAYRVIAVKSYKGKVIKSAPAKIRKRAVARLHIYVTFQKTKKYGSSKVRKGTRMLTDGYGGGYYVFTYKGKRRTVPRVSVSNPSARYDNDRKYTKEEASNFINGYVRANKIKSSKKYLIWVSTYTQRMYIFKKSGGKWKTVRSWRVSTGKATTPTSTGTKKIKKKVSSRHAIPYWSCFSGWNALHGISSGMGAYLGRPASGGCVRNSVKNAGWIYRHCGKGTSIVIY